MLLLSFLAGVCKVACVLEDFAALICKNFTGFDLMESVLVLMDLLCEVFRDVATDEYLEIEAF